MAFIGQGFTLERYDARGGSYLSGGLRRSWSLEVLTSREVPLHLFVEANNGLLRSTAVVAASRSRRMVGRGAGEHALTEVRRHLRSQIDEGCDVLFPLSRADGCNRSSAQTNCSLRKCQTVSRLEVGAASGR